MYHCHRLALAYLRRKVASGRLNLNHFNLTLDDLALDSIADLFERDEHDTFPRINCFFSSVNFLSTEEEECCALTRQLVFSEVNRHLFRLYRESDPSLGRIIRNLKNGIKVFHNLSIERLGNELWLYVLDEDQCRGSLPVITPEVLEIYLADCTSLGASLKAFLSAFRDILSAEKPYASRFPLVGLALIVRSMMSRGQDVSTNGVETTEDGFAVEDIRVLVDESVEAIRTRMRGPYLEKQKLSTSAYSALFAAVHDILTAQYVDDDGDEFSLYEHLHRHMAALTPSDYQHCFRVYLEYFNKLSRQQLLDAARKELG